MSTTAERALISFNSYGEAISRERSGVCAQQKYSA